MKKHRYNFKLITVTLIAIIFLCRLSSGQSNNDLKNDIQGLSFFNNIIGMWHGPVYSDTPAGSFNEWHVDFRPVSGAQASQYSNMDSNTINYTSFFIIKYNNQLKIAMRTEGVFKNKGCVTYEVMDSVNKENGYYRFADFMSGEKRAFTEFKFKDDSLIMEVYTTKFNKLEKPSLHSKWTAVLSDRTAAKEAKEHFNYPQAVMIKDFSTAFKNMNESIFFSFENDPYPSNPQPYVGSVTFNISLADNLKKSETHELFIVLTTKSLFDGLKYNPDNLKYFSKYLYLPENTKSFTLKNIHPGTYYLYSYDDINGDKRHKSGDYMSSDINNIIQVLPEDTITVETKIDMVIP